MQRGAIFLKISEEINWQKKRKILDVKPLLLVRKFKSVVFAAELNEMCLKGLTIRTYGAYQSYWEVGNHSCAWRQTKVEVFQYNTSENQS